MIFLHTDTDAMKYIFYKKKCLDFNWILFDYFPRYNIHQVDEIQTLIFNLLLLVLACCHDNWCGAC